MKFTICENDKNSKVYKCKICGTSFSSKKSCTDHYDLAHFRNQKEVRRLLEKNKPASYKCEICEKRFHTKSLLTQHQKWHREWNHECNICQKMFPSKKLVKKHRTLRHSPKSISCRWNCGQTFNTHGGRMIHEKTTHYVNKPLEKICDICGKPCPTEIGFKFHRNTHLNPSERNKEFECSICSKLFPTTGQRTDHKKSVHNTARFGCPKCNKTFVIEKYLKLHVEKHELSVERKDARLHSCHQCSDDVKFNISGLRRHLKSQHSEIYTCDECQKVFKNLNPKHRYNLHMRKHQNSKCHLCNLVLANPMNARIHLLQVHKLTIEQLIQCGRYDPNSNKNPNKKRGGSWMIDSFMNRYV